MKTSVVCFPFDLFGSSGARAGVELLADAFRELLEDNRRERVPTRARAYERQVRLNEFSFDRLAAYEQWRDLGRLAAREAWSKDQMLFWLTGNHLGVLPVYDELARRQPQTLVVQLDAHLDVYNLADCTSALSHGNFLLHCDGPLPRIVNVGHRELLLRPQHIARYYENAYSAAEFAVEGERIVAELREAAGAASSVFLDIDCDVLDQAYFPAVPHAVPFGLSPSALIQLIDAVWSERVIGLALSEFDPARDQNDRCLATLMWLLEYLLLKHYEAAKPGRSTPRRKAGVGVRRSRATD